MNKVVLITGASKGIGAACAQIFASNGYDVIINYNTSMQQANTLKEEIRKKYNVKCLAYKCDVSNEKEVINFLENVKKDFSKIDVLINNAGIAMDNFLDKKTVEEFKQVINTNLVGTFIITKYFSKIMDEGSIINISSTNAIDSYYPESIDYDASKAGIISLTHNYAKAFAPKIRVNALCPGWVNTKHNDLLTEEEKASLSKDILLGRFGSPMEIAKVVFFVANDASYINNAIIRVDGGELC